MAVSMSTDGHQHLCERHAGQAGSHADGKFVTSMPAVLLLVSGPLTAKAFEFLNAEKHTTRGVTRAMR